MSQATRSKNGRIADKIFGDGKQLSLSDTPECSTEHNLILVRYNKTKCPYCGTDLSNRQMSIGDYNNV